MKELYGYRCAYCMKTGVKLTKDHLTPRSKGGENHPDNIAPACYECNQKKVDKPIWSML